MGWGRGFNPIAVERRAGVGASGAAAGVLVFSRFFRPSGVGRVAARDFPMHLTLLPHHGEILGKITDFSYNGGRKTRTARHERSIRAITGEQMTKKENALAALVLITDELGDLEAEVAPWRAKFARVEVLRAALRAAFASADAGKSFRSEGERWAALIGPMGGVSVVDRLALLKLIGPKKFVAIAAVSLKAIEEAHGAGVVGAVVSVEPRGPRSLALVPAAAKAKEVA